MKKKITWEQNKYTTIKNTVEVTFPAIYLDEFGFYNYSPNENETICIGLNGVISNKPGTHSIIHHKFFCGERYSKKKRDLTLNEWRQALNEVKKYVSEQIDQTL